MIRASCTWGEGPDVLVAIDGHYFVLRENPIDVGKWTHGAVTGGWMDLTKAQARDLANQLLEAADYADELDRSYEEYVKREGETIGN